MRTVLVSYPKAGRTWLREMLDSLDIPLEYTHDGSSHGEAHHYTQLSRDKTPYRDSAAIVLTRDPRDTAVSGYFQATKRLRNWSGDLSTFIRDPCHGIRKIMTFYRHWSENDNLPPRVHRLRYEDLHADALATLGVLTNWLDRPIREDVLRQAVATHTFEQMQRRERSGQYQQGALRPGDPNDPESFKCRKGEVGGWRNYLGAADAEYCAEEMVAGGFGVLWH